MTEPPASREAAHAQAAYAVRCDWGPTGAAALVADGPELAVVVDVLSFTTTLTVAAERGISVLPYRWRDEHATAHAAEHDAVLAVGRFEASLLDDGGDAVPSLSPAAMGRVAGVERVVLPSPNGSTIAFALRDAGARVVGACLRNRAAVAGWLAPRLRDGARLAVVPAGERWPDDTLRPCTEDLWGAGAVLSALVDLGGTGLSPEAEVAVDAWRAVADGVGARLAACAGGRELAAAGFAADVEVAAGLDVSGVVPVLRGHAFIDAAAG